MLKRLDESLPLADVSGLAESELAGRIYLACRGVPDYLMTLVRGALVDAIGQHGKRIELADLARVYERSLAQQRVLVEQSNPFIGALSPESRGGRMESLIILAVVVGVGYWFYKAGKRQGSRSGYHAGLRRRRFRR